MLVAGVTEVPTELLVSCRAVPFLCRRFCALLMAPSAARGPSKGFPTLQSIATSEPFATGTMSFREKRKEKLFFFKRCFKKKMLKKNRTCFFQENITIQ